MNGTVNEVKREEIINQAKKKISNHNCEKHPSKHPPGGLPQRRSIIAVIYRLAHRTNILALFLHESKLPIFAISIKDFVSLHPIPSTQLPSAPTLLPEGRRKKRERTYHSSKASPCPSIQCFFSDITNRNRECALSCRTLCESSLVRWECGRDL